ncbi:hypothetical protein Tco_1315505 [Tanacetum coccineum]
MQVHKKLIKMQEPAKASSTNIVNTASTPVSTASPYGGLSFTNLTNTDQDDLEIPALEEIYANPTDGIFTNSSYDDEGTVADFTNLEPVVNVRRTAAIQDSKSLDSCRLLMVRRQLEQNRCFLLWPGLKPLGLLAFASYMGFIVYQMDVKSAFLYGKIDEESMKSHNKRLSFSCRDYFLAMQKATIVATSTTEAEYVAAANCCGQVLWIQNQM